MKSHVLGDRSVLTVVMGMKNDGQGTVVRWMKDRAWVVGKFPIPFDVRKDGGIWYDPKWLQQYYSCRYPELGNKSLNDLIFDGNTKGFRLASFGADILAVDRSNNPRAGINYPSCLRSKLIDRWKGEISPASWHLDFGGAAFGAYQPLFQLGYLEEHLPEEFWRDVGAVVPVTDWLYYSLTGQTAHDRVMLQSQGLLGPSRDAVASRFGDPLPSGTLCPWQVLDRNAVFLKDGVHIGSSTHDSVPGRDVGFCAGHKIVVWTGSWLGVAFLIGPGIVPCTKTLDAGGSFEGLWPPALQKNTCFGGPVYRELLKRAKLTYETASVSILAHENLPTLNLSRLENLTPEQGASHVVDVLRAARQDPTPVRALATLVHAVVEAVWKDLQALAKALGVPLDTVAIVGGWSENAAFCELLGRKGVRVVIPPSAAYATDAGLAAGLLNGITRVEGTEVSVAEVLKQLPPVEEKE